MILSHEMGGPDEAEEDAGRKPDLLFVRFL
jgi:hypothetical protein